MRIVRKECSFRSDGDGKISATRTQTNDAHHGDTLCRRGSGQQAILDCGRSLLTLIYPFEERVREELDRFVKYRILAASFLERHPLDRIRIGPCTGEASLQGLIRLFRPSKVNQGVIYSTKNKNIACKLPYLQNCSRGGSIPTREGRPEWPDDGPTSKDDILANIDAAGHPGGTARV